MTASRAPWASARIAFGSESSTVLPGLVGGALRLVTPVKVLITLDVFNLKHYLRNMSFTFSRSSAPRRRVSRRVMLERRWAFDRSVPPVSQVRQTWH
jgi:hypothetical protein